MKASGRRALLARLNRYIASPVNPVAQHATHFPSAHGGVRFILWHRNFLQAFDDWQRTDALAGNRPFVPLAFWYPGDPLPKGFPFAGRNPVIPTFPLPPQLAGRAALAAITDVEVLATEIETNYHNPIHGAIGGVMTGGQAPRDPIFWLLHAFFDHVVANWETIHGDLVDGGPM